MAAKLFSESIGSLVYELYTRKCRALFLSSIYTVYIYFFQLSELVFLGTNVRKGKFFFIPLYGNLFVYFDNK